MLQFWSLKISFIGILLFGITSCKKENLFDSKTTGEKLTSTNWQIVDAQIGYRVSILESCDLDNIISMQPDGKCLLDRGVNLCDSTESRFYKGNWYLLANEKKINLLGHTYDIAILQKEYLRMWLRDFVTNSNDTVDIYIMYKSVSR